MALGNAQLYETTRALADRDPLTGFFNHRYLHERLGEEILRAQRSGAPLALLMIDLDDFKLVNDTLGHLFGDEVLRWAAEQIRGALRGSDVAARYGGDEFAVILPDTPAAGAREVGERIVAALRDRPYQAEGRGPVPVGASVGRRLVPGRRADRAGAHRRRRRRPLPGQGDRREGRRKAGSGAAWPRPRAGRDRGGEPPRPRRAVAGGASARRRVDARRWRARILCGRP